jgi:hypothetical protein
MDKGFVIIAQNTENVDYIGCAEVLAKSIYKQMPDAKVSLITSLKFKNKLFDKVIPLPYGDLDPTGSWKLINDWQVYEASPYEYTIKLEADMYLPASIDHWWDVLKNRDLVISTTIRNFKQEISKSRAYRRFIDDNKLPDCYNSLTYFKKSELAENFFKIVRNVFENWDEYKAILKCNPDEQVSTDWAYALACHILGIENTTLPSFTEMSMIHMKRFINDLPTEKWTDTLVCEVLPHTLRVNTYPQKYPFHYHIKTFSDELRNKV